MNCVVMGARVIYVCLEDKHSHVFKTYHVQLIFREDNSFLGQRATAKLLVNIPVLFCKIKKICQT